MNRLHVRLALVLVIFVSACSSKDLPRTLGVGETALDTGGKTPILFHSALYYPSEISLRFPGYIVGIEKSPKDLVSQEGDVMKIEIPGAGEEFKEHTDRIGEDKKLLYISHILENFGEQHGLKNCVHYSAYYRGNDDYAPVEPCDPRRIEQIQPSQAYVKSWDALKILRKELETKIASGDYTHIFVGVMGWNTSQEEAVRNFNSVGKNIRLAVNEQNGKAMHAGRSRDKTMVPAAQNDPFRPLFIGFTWPSLWASDWLTPIRTLFSYGNKADDADEVGFSWLGVLLHDTLRDLPQQLPIIVLGHSFGGRVSSMGVCVGPVISEDGTSIPRNTIDMLISLQGAYSMNRFYPDKGREGIVYPGSCKHAKHVVLTASKNDKAMDNKRWVPFVGNNSTYEKYCKKKPDAQFDCVTAEANGDVSLPSNSTAHKTYINADDLIYFNAYGSGGVAHSDIYRKEMGKMLWEVIAAKTSTSH